MANDINAKLKTLKSSHSFIKNVDFCFPDTETCAEINIDPRNSEVYIVQGLKEPLSGKTVNDNLMGLLASARLFKEYGAKSITAIIPYLAYTRQDRFFYDKFQPITARLIPDMLKSAGVDNILTWHVANEFIKGFYTNLGFFSINPIPFFYEVFKEYEKRDDVAIIAPDQGSLKWANRLGQKLEIESGFAIKKRLNHSKIIIENLILKKKEYKDIIVFDDLISTGSTLYFLLKKITKEINPDNIIIGVSHSISSDIGLESLIKMKKEFPLKEVILTDTIQQDAMIDKISFVKKKTISEHLATFILKQNRS
ncbi:MAG: ribose-phosphate pyrophosphokinase [Lentisphaerae bacterium]|nr:ribose-phosphate pyrophosphokinase [Lentisphaerota bacterium]